MKAVNTIRFSGRVHMSGYTKPLQHLETKDEGVGHWMLYDDAIFTTWPCIDNRQWFIGVAVSTSINPAWCFLSLPPHPANI